MQIGLPPGNYTVTVEKDGMKQTSNVRVQSRHRRDDDHAEAGRVGRADDEGRGGQGAGEDGRR